MKKRTNFKTKSGKHHSSPETIKRLSLYLRNLKRLLEAGVEIISSDKITQFLNVTPVQFRKDLSCFGEFGKRGVGYEVRKLIAELEMILGVDNAWAIALVGAGSLGRALLRFEGFSRFNLQITHVFDSNPKVIGKIISGVEVKDSRNLSEIVEKQKIKIAIIATPPEAAQYTAEQVIKGGVKGILNFAPLVLRVSSDVYVSNVDMACEMESLIFFVKQIGS